MTKFADKPFALVGVHVGGGDAGQLKKLMDEAKLPWRSFVDEGNPVAGPIAKRWNVSMTPTFYAIDGEGAIRYKWFGAPGEKVMDAALETLIEEAEEGGAESR